jgi:hypothetical protein
MHESPRGVLSQRSRPDPSELLDLVVATDPRVEPSELKQLCDLESWPIAPETPTRIEPVSSAERLTIFVDHPFEELTVFGRRTGERWWPWLRPAVLIVATAMSKKPPGE